MLIPCEFCGKIETDCKCPVCKGRAQWFTCSENKVGASECPTCKGTGVVATSPIGGGELSSPATGTNRKQD